MFVLKVAAVLLLIVVAGRVRCGSCSVLAVRVVLPVFWCKSLYSKTGNKVLFYLFLCLCSTHELKKCEFC